MGSLIAPLIGVGLSLLSGSKESKDISGAGREAVEGLQPFARQGTRANRNVLNALGFGDTEKVGAAFQNFLNSSGFRAQLSAGSEAITGNQAARGLLNSGSTLKRLNRFGQDLAQQGFSNFIGQLSGVADRGLSAATSTAGVLGQTGQAAAEAKGSGFSNAIKGIGQVFATPITSKIFG